VREIELKKERIETLLEELVERGTNVELLWERIVEVEREVNGLRTEIAERDAAAQPLSKYLYRSLQFEYHKCTFDDNKDCLHHGWYGIKGKCPTAAARAYVAKHETKVE